MGREAECICHWRGSRARVKVLLEPPDLILRGEVRRRIPLSQMTEMGVEGDSLRFAVDGESVALELGNALARKWADALAAPQPTLAKKLGITAETLVRMVGTADDEALCEALRHARSVTDQHGDLIVARVDLPGQVADALSQTADQLGQGVPIWFIYRKGKGHAVSEAEIRSAALATGIVDTKIAAVSKTLTATRFVKRKK